MVLVPVAWKARCVHSVIHMQPSDPNTASNCTETYQVPGMYRYYL
jgi:hypothetical protein